MKANLPFRKASLLIPTGPCHHLHIICNDPVFYPAKVKDCVLAVNISSISTGIEYDASCVLTQGEHPFIKSPSYVYYRKADIFGANSISLNIANGSFTLHESFDDLIFEKILSGFAISNEVRPKIKKFYQQYCL